MSDLPEFLVRAALGVLITALVAGPIGCFVVWRRMAYFGDSLAHSALLGAALGIALGIAPAWAVLGMVLIYAGMLAWLQNQPGLASDTALGVMAHSALAFGLVAAALMEDRRLDLYGLLFGDPLAISRDDLVLMAAMGIAALGGLAVLWRPLLALTVNEELARIDGTRTGQVRLGFLALVAATVALGMQAVGVVLVTALLIVPAATAGRFARSPEQMAWMAAGLGLIGGALGLSLSWTADLPPGPAIVVCSAALFALSRVVPARA